MMSTLIMVIVLYLVINLFCLVKCNTKNKTISPTEDLLTLRNLCPYNKFCHSSPLKVINDDNLEPCCEECSCETNCFKTGSCCPDMHLTGLVEPKYPCRHLWHFGKGAHFLNDDSYYFEYWYHVIDDCPDMTKSISYQRCIKPVTVQDYVIVTDTKTGKVYRNKHCAECNNIRSFDYLKLRLDCRDPFFMTNFTPKERDQYVMANCTLSSLPPENPIALSHCIPEAHLISTCNSTGSWDFYNNEIERACIENNSQNQNTIFKRLSNSSRKPDDYFANVYCFLCNVHSSERKTDACNIIDGSNGYKSSQISFYLILDAKMWETITVRTDETKCSSTEIFDPVRGICRKLFCPAGHIPDYGNCKGLFSNINGYTQAMHFEITTKFGKLTDYTILLRFLATRVFRELGTDLTCGVCRSTLYSGKLSTSQIYFRIGVFAKEGCPYSILLERIRKIAIKEELFLQFKNRSQVVRLVMTLVFEDIDHTTGFNELAESLSAFCIGPSTIVDETILLYCPTIMLSGDEVYELRLRNASVLPRFNSNATFQQVCVDDYFSANLMNSLSAVDDCFMFRNVFMMLSMMFAIDSVL